MKAHRRAHVVVTGGEPMIAPEIVPLTERLRAGAACTSPSRPRARFSQPVACDLMSISPKLANSTPDGPLGGAARAAAHPAAMCCAELMARYEYQLKFVMERPAGPGGSARRWWNGWARIASA